MMFKNIVKAPPPKKGQPLGRSICYPATLGSDTDLIGRLREQADSRRGCWAPFTEHSWSGASVLEQRASGRSVLVGQGTSNKWLMESQPARQSNMA